MFLVKLGHPMSELTPAPQPLGVNGQRRSNAGEELVAILSIAVLVDASIQPASALQARLLASAIDYASVLGVVAGAAIAVHLESATERSALRRVLAERAFFPVYQPIVVLRTGQPIGYEALTRFVDGTPPDVRFARAAAVGVGFDFELAAIEAAIAGAPPIDGDAFLAVNVSPDLVVRAGRRLRGVLERHRSVSSSKSRSMRRSPTTARSAAPSRGSARSRSRSTMPEPVTPACVTSSRSDRPG